MFVTGSIKSLAICLVACTTLAACQLLIPQFDQHDAQLALQPSVHDPTMPSLTDCLTVEKSLSLFYEYARELPEVMNRLQGGTKTTLLVPVDRAIIALPRKPHQDPVDVTPNIDPMTYTQSDESINKNVQRFVTAHIIPEDIPPQPALNVAYQTLLDGVTVAFRQDDKTSELRVDPGDVKVLKTVDAANGRIFYLDGIVTY